MGNLADLSGLGRDQLMESATPALRAALDRYMTPASRRTSELFQSFTGPVA